LAHLAQQYEQRGLQLFDEEPDVSGLQEYARQRSKEGNSAGLNALAAQFAGKSFEPMQAHFLKQALAAQEPLKVGNSGYITSKGEFVRDPLARNDRRADSLLRTAMSIYNLDERQQRAGLFLRDVAYRLHARFELTGRLQTVEDNSGKYAEMFRRRAAKGQCVNQPYLGCREFDARFRLIESAVGEPAPLASVDGDFGWMLYDMDFRQPADPRPMFFRARIVQGVLDLTKAEVRS
jgi:hypothetical protein